MRINDGQNFAFNVKYTHDLANQVNDLIKGYDKKRITRLECGESYLNVQNEESIRVLKLVLGCI